LAGVQSWLRRLYSAIATPLAASFTLPSGQMSRLLFWALLGLGGLALALGSVIYFLLPRLRRKPASTPPGRAEDDPETEAFGIFAGPRREPRLDQGAQKFGRIPDPIPPPAAASDPMAEDLRSGWAVAAGAGADEPAWPDWYLPASTGVPASSQIWEEMWANPDSDPFGNPVLTEDPQTPRW